MKFKFADKVIIKDNEFFEGMKGTVIDTRNSLSLNKVGEFTEDFLVDIFNKLNHTEKWFNEENLEKIK